MTGQVSADEACFGLPMADSAKYREVVNASEPTRLISSHTSTTSRFSPAARVVPIVGRRPGAAAGAAVSAGGARAFEPL